jgi:DNA-binding NarL/FixJ family response regulator
VLIADDQALVRAGFAMILAAQPDMAVVGEVADGAEAIRAARALRPDVVLMDIRMPNVDGIEATTAICRDTHAKVLVLTTFDLDEYVYDALRAGASGFLLKDMRRDELVEAVRVVAAGEALLAPAVTRRLIADVVTRSRPPAPPRANAGWRHSPPGRPTHCGRSPAGCPTRRLRLSCTSPSTPSRRTSAACSPSWACATGYRRWCWPTNRV